MKSCVSFPEENILIVRPCLIAICAGIRPAAKLLSVLLYRYSIRQEHKEEAENLNEVRVAQGQRADQDISFRIYRKQAQLVSDMCGEITEKTLHDVAVPWLQLLDYLDIEELHGRNCYDLHIDLIQQAIKLYVPGKKEQKPLENFLIRNMQLEKFLITTKLEKFPIDKNFFHLALEKILIANRNFSHCQRGPKPRPKAAAGAKSEDPQNLLEIGNENSNGEKEEETHISTGEEKNGKEVSSPSPPTDEEDIWKEIDGLFAKGEITEEEWREAREQYGQNAIEERSDQLPIVIEATNEEKTARSMGEQKAGDDWEASPVQVATSTNASTLVRGTKTPTETDTGQYTDHSTETPPLSSSSPPLVHMTNKSGENKKDGEEISGQEQQGSNVGGKSGRKVVDIVGKRVEQLYTWLDECMREVTGKPEVGYARTEKFTAALVEYALPCNPNREEVRLTWFDMWNEKDTDGKYWWRGRGRLTPAAWGRHHANRLMSITAEEKESPPASAQGETAPADNAATQGGGSAIRNLSAEFRVMREKYGQRKTPVGAAKGGS